MSLTSLALDSVSARFAGPESMIGNTSPEISLKAFRALSRACRACTAVRD